MVADRFAKNDASKRPQLKFGPFWNQWKSMEINRSRMISLQVIEVGGNQWGRRWNFVPKGRKHKGAERKRCPPRRSNWRMLLIENHMDAMETKDKSTASHSNLFIDRTRKVCSLRPAKTMLPQRPSWSIISCFIDENHFFNELAQKETSKMGDRN